MTSPKSRDQQNTSPNQRLLKSLGCIGGIGLLGSSSLLSSIALAEDAVVDASPEADIPALLGAEQPAAAPAPIPEPQIVAEATFDSVPAVAYEPAPEPIYEEPVAPEPAYVEPAYVEPAYVEPAYVEPAYEEPAYVEPYVEPAPEPAYVPEAAYEPEPAYVPEAVYEADPVYAPEPVYEEPAYEEPAYTESYSDPAPAETYAPEPVAAPLPSPDLQAPVVELTPADLTAPSEDAFTSAPINDGYGSGSVIDNSDLYSTGATNQDGSQQLDQPTVVVTEQDPAPGCSATLQVDGLSCDEPTTIAAPAPLPGTSAPSVAETAGMTEAAGVAGATGVVDAAPGAAPHLNTGETTGTANVAEAEAPTLNPSANPADALPTVTLSSEELASTSSTYAPAQAALPAPAVAPTTRITGNVSASNGYSVTVPSKLQNPLSFAVSSLGRSFSQSMDAASYYARTQRPSALPGNGDRSLLFPLSMPAPVSSVFGWRMHPIHNVWRFHSGTDFAAEQGAPIVAPLSGTVGLADFVGGYGLTVTLDHTDGNTQTLFGHMSELFVRPGQYVRQGEVIGRVGSTGYSTGPHLHFEVRKRDASGSWVAMDPGLHLEGSLAQLMKVLRNEPLQLSPIPIAQSPFKIKPSLSTGLLPLLQQQPQALALAQQQQTQANPFQSQQLQFQQQPVAINPATPLERAVVQVVRSLEGQPASRLQPARPQVNRWATRPTVPAANSALNQPLSSAFPQVPEAQQSSQPVELQQPQKLSQLIHDQER